MFAYINLIHGNDATGQLGNPRLPYLTHAAVKTAIEEWSASQCAADDNPETNERVRGLTIIDQGDALPAQFRL
jgi:hypothetical protein